jgi:hypothetical protein
MACVFALLDKTHDLIYWVKGDECILLMVSQMEITGRHCDITYSLDRYGWM